MAGSGSGVPVSSPTVDTGTTIEVLNGDRVTPTTQSEIAVYNSAYPNTEFTIKILRRLAANPKSPETDMVVETVTTTSDAGGGATLKWTPPSNATSGSFFKYYPAVWIGNEPAAVASSKEDISVYSKANILISDLDSGLGPAQAIPVYTEISKDSGVVVGSGTRTSFDFTWNNWNTYFSPVVYTLTEEEEALKTYGDDYSVNFKEGIINFSQGIPSYADVEASYIFKYFSEAQLLKFLEQSLAMMNFVAPYTSFTLDSYPDYWRYAIVCGGIMMGLEQLFQAPLYRERRLLFSDADMVGTLSSYYDRIKSSFKEDFMGKKARWSLITPRAISGHDIIAPPRVTAQSYQSWAYLRGRGI